jgi:hypothetical protein
MTDAMTGVGNDPMLTRYDGPSPALEIARDLLKRGLYLVPAAVIIGAIVGGASGIASVLYALALSLGNFVLAAALIGWGARISAVAMGAAAMFGFLIRLLLVFAAFFVFRNASWMQPVAFGITIIVTHLGLLFWEMRHVSASLAYPGLKPGARREPRSK